GVARRPEAPSHSTRHAEFGVSKSFPHNLSYRVFKEPRHRNHAMPANIAGLVGEHRTREVPAPQFLESLVVGPRHLCVHHIRVEATLGAPIVDCLLHTNLHAVLCEFPEFARFSFSGSRVRHSGNPASLPVHRGGVGTLPT